MNPLGEDHLKRLDAVLASCAQTAEYLGKCEACGLDVSRAKSENEGQAELAKRIKAQFFPDRR